MSSGGSKGSRGSRRDYRCLATPLSVADVYDIASDIGKEFEALIDSHGADHVVELMQKVIAALEHLEKFAAEIEGEKQTIDDLRTTITHLELEEIKRNEERQRNASELEQIEEHYKQETRDLLSTVKRLQDENRKLSSSLAAATENRDSAFSEDEAYFEVDLVNRLQTTIEKQRSQIKKLDQSVLNYKIENDEVRKQNETLSSCTKDLRRKVRTVQTQLHEMVDERAELTAKVHESQRDIQTLEKQLGSVEKECEDLSLATSIANQSPSVDLKGKLVFSENDPNRPRFTLQELKDILQERNSLKARVSDLEDELAVFKPSRIHTSSVNSPRKGYRVRMTGPANCDCSYHSRGGLDSSGSIETDDDIIQVAVGKEATETLKDEMDEEDLPVQGPLPEDPDDAPWKKQESGIRKLFRRVFGSSETGTPLKTSISTPSLYQPDPDSTPTPNSIKKSFSRFSFLPPPSESSATSQCLQETEEE